MARDKIHDAVKNALIKDGWTILADPFAIEYEEVALSADLAAERPFAAAKGSQKIVVEIKTFGGRSFIKQLQQALGQYEMYFDYLNLTTPEYELYLGISEIVYNDFFLQRAIQVLIQRRRLRLVIVDLDTEEVVSWIK